MFPATAEMLTLLWPDGGATWTVNELEPGVNWMLLMAP